MKVSVIGCGRWGTFLAWYLDSQNCKTTLYGRSNSAKLQELKEQRRNEYVTLSPTITLEDDIEAALQSEYLFVSIDAQNFRSFLQGLSGYNLAGKTLVLCMKGLEKETGKRLSEIAEEFVGPDTPVVIWTGPGHIQDFVAGIPNCMVLDSKNDVAKRELIHRLGSQLIRFYIGTDLIGNEIGAAAKNVYGIAAGMLDALGYSSLKGALVVRASVEISRFIEQLGGKERSVYGLSFLGECETTFFSKFSNNRQFGENFIRGVPTNKLSEGLYTLDSLYVQSQRVGVEMPICNVLHQVIHERADAKEVLPNLFLRSVKEEF